MNLSARELMQDFADTPDMTQEVLQLSSWNINLKNKSQRRIQYQTTLNNNNIITMIINIIDMLINNSKQNHRI